MKKYCLVLSFAFFTHIGHAETIPPGCYVADYYRLDPCWSAFDNFYFWPDRGSRIANAAYYGPTVEAIINTGFIDRAGLNVCNADYNNLVAQYNANDAQRVNQYNVLVSDYNKLLATSKRLRKKCGKPCKKIK